MHNCFQLSGSGAVCTPGRRARLLAALATLAVGLGGCSYALPSIPMPDLIRDPRKLLTKEEQQQAIEDLTEKKEAQQAETARRVEKTK